MEHNQHRSARTHVKDSTSPSKSHHNDQTCETPCDSHQKDHTSKRDQHSHKAKPDHKHQGKR